MLIYYYSTAYIFIIDKRTDDSVIPGRTDDLYFEGGIKSYVEFLLSGMKKERLNKEVIYLNTTQGDASAEIAFLWSTAYDTKLMTFANTIHTV